MASFENPPLAWRKSTASQASDCAEVAVAGGRVFVRDSAHRDGTLLTFPAAPWSAFVQRVRGALAGPQS
jgi:hypothetical protein